MKYQFREKESYLCDLLSVPGMIHYKEEDLNNKDENYIDLIPESSKIIAREMHEMVMRYKEQLIPFYYSAPEDRDFNQILGMMNPVIGYEDVSEYFESILKKPEDEILYGVLLALDYFDQDTGEEDKETSKKKAKELVEHREQIMPWLNALSIGSDAKWHLLSFTQSPKRTLEKYKEVIEEIHPIFLKYYEGFRKKVITYAEDFIRRLSEIEGDSLSAVSNGIVSENLLQTEEMDVVISIVNEFAVMLNAANEKPYMSWGLNIESIFNAISEIEDNKIQERVLLFKNFGDKTRYEVIMNIAKGITSTKIIAKNLGVSSATVSYHLNNLVTAKVIFLKQSEGRYIYQVNKAFIEKCIEDLKEDFLLT
ncbi:ArsR family transcriptional regulator [Proteiniclasticum sp.]|uniref:ArsR/SmtB family transcription factor n=1 Tax=Proteiniclasticum sp. TaxID=2053595 RepID=UPI0028A05E0A|nr:ArsR family transcriptional regulator [Proteiniclasticum sp.]